MASTHHLQSGNHLCGGNRDAGTSSRQSYTNLDLDLNLSPEEQFGGEDYVSVIPLNIVPVTGDSSVQGEQPAPLIDPRVLPEPTLLMPPKVRTFFLGAEESEKEAVKALVKMSHEKNIAKRRKEPEGNCSTVGHPSSEFARNFGNREAVSQITQSLLWKISCREDAQAGPSNVPNGLPFDNRVLQNLVEACNRTNNRMQCLELFPRGNMKRNIVMDPEELPSLSLGKYHRQMEMAMFGHLDRNSPFAPRERNVISIHNSSLSRLSMPSATPTEHETGRAETAHLPERSCSGSSNRNPAELTHPGAGNDGRNEFVKGKKTVQSRERASVVKSGDSKRRKNVGVVLKDT